jgi:putative MATE family efflux protein
LKKEEIISLTEGPVIKVLIIKTIPMIIGMLAMISFALVDAYFVGRLGTRELAALGFTFPIVFFINGISLGLGTGASALISRAIGMKDTEKVKRLSSDTLMLTLIIVAIFIVIGIFSFDFLFRAMGVEDDVLPLVKAYMYYWYPGMIFVVIPMVGNSITRATGDTKTPSLIMIMAVVLNAIFDPIFIFGWGPIPRMELEGAAIAAVASRFVTLIVSLWILYYRDKMLTFHFPNLKEVWASWKSIMYIGLPSAGTNVIVPLAAGILTGLISTFGHEAVAAFGVASRIDAVALSAMMGLGSVLGPFIGQNLGAGNIDRLKAGIRVSNQFAMFWGLALAIIFFFTGSHFGGLFDKNPKVIEYITSYLKIVPIAYGFHGALLLIGVAFNVLNKPFYSASIMLTRMFGILVPLAYLGAHLLGIQGIFWAVIIANSSVGLFGFYFLKRHLAKLS